VIGGSATAAGVDEVHSVETNDDAAALLSGLANPGDLILVKGSRSAGMERIIASLSDLRGALAAGQRPALH
jgi:UDP-N-acetylmuramoyl-tripeptide--D-alanyl-D-alanine ligase